MPSEPDPVVHLELHTGDLARACAFYAGLRLGPKLPLYYAALSAGPGVALLVQDIDSPTFGSHGAPALFASAWAALDVQPLCDFGLQAMEAAWMSNRQIEAARRAMTRHVKRGGQIWIRVFPDKSITKKPAETRMGSGKGNPEGWVAVIKPGRVLFEMGGVTEQVAKEAMKLAAAKLPMKTRVISAAETGVLR